MTYTSDETSLQGNAIGVDESWRGLRKRCELSRDESGRSSVPAILQWYPSSTPVTKEIQTATQKWPWARLPAEGQLRVESWEEYEDKG
ncbi:hypothetical protein RB195_004711 [Necator americanus]|uniref:Uncharacterized protein n=1 Tax=Necator americanus TaxID=51031 RepID=A0ABR1BJB7_NECAM